MKKYIKPVVNNSIVVSIERNFVNSCVERNNYRNPCSYCTKKQDSWQCDGCIYDRRHRKENK